MGLKTIQNFFNGATDGIVAREDHRLAVKDTITFTEIDLKDRVIRKTWKLMGLVFSNTYELDNHASVLIKDRSMIFEGYKIDSFEVYIANRGVKIRILLSDDFNEASLIQSEITAFLARSAARSFANADAAASGAQRA